MTTFEELIDENTNWSKATLGGYEKAISTKKCLKLLHQVREATVAECIDKISELHGSFYKGAYEEYLATNLPTNSIKTDL